MVLESPLSSVRPKHVSEVLDIRWDEYLSYVCLLKIDFYFVIFSQLVIASIVWKWEGMIFGINCLIASWIVLFLVTF